MVRDSKGNGQNIAGWLICLDTPDKDTVATIWEFITLAKRLGLDIEATKLLVEKRYPLGTVRWL